MQYAFDTLNVYSRKNLQFPSVVPDKRLSNICRYQQTVFFGTSVCVAVDFGFSVAAQLVEREIRKKRVLRRKARYPQIFLEKSVLRNSYPEYVNGGAAASESQRVDVGGGKACCLGICLHDRVFIYNNSVGGA